MTNNTSPLILAVDDDPNFLEIIQARLEAQGYRIATAEDGNEAIKQTKKLHPALVLMDIEMPGKDGMSAASELAADPKTKDIPTIFMTNLRKELVESLAAGVSFHLDNKNYFQKDGDYARLMTNIRSTVALA